jgi:hypothetical protein
LQGFTIAIETFVVLPLAFCRGDDFFLQNVTSEQPLLQPLWQAAEQVGHLHGNGSWQVTHDRRGKDESSVAKWIQTADIPMIEAGTEDGHVLPQGAPSAIWQFNHRCQPY